jgi:hypothetical protein
MALKRPRNILKKEKSMLTLIKGPGLSYRVQDQNVQIIDPSIQIENPSIQIENPEPVTTGFKTKLEESIYKNQMDLVLKHLNLQI